MWKYNHTNTLCHYGVPGMKWGVRRASKMLVGKKKSTKVKPELTPEQKKARNKKIVTGILAGLGTVAVTAGAIYYAKNKSKVDAVVGKAFADTKSKINKTVKKFKPTAKQKAKTKSRLKDVKRASLLTDDQLKQKIARLESEKKLKNLTSEVVTPGRAAVNKILINAGTSATTTMVTGGILYGTKVALTKNASAKEAADYITPKPKKK